MWVTILPFLLVANVTVNDFYRHPAWKNRNLHYEYTYELVLDMSLANVTKETDNYCRMVAAELKCQTKGNDTLICYIANGRKAIHMSERCTHEDKFSPEFETFRRNDDLFEVRFSEQGIEDFIVSKNIHAYKLEIIKEVMKLLDIGISITTDSTRDPTFAHGLFAVDMVQHIKKKEDKKNSYDCEYDTILNRSVLDTEEDHSLESENFQLAFISSEDVMTWVGPHQIGGPRRAEKWHLIIQRKICTCSPILIFGNEIREQYNNTEVHTEVIASVRDIKFSKNEFKSSTVSDALMYISTSRIMPIKQILSIDLKRIDVTKCPLPKIKNPILTSMR